MADCPEPELSGSSNAALSTWANGLKWSLRACNKDKAGLRAWAEEVAK